jgi:hypothetical protein
MTPSLPELQRRFAAALVEDDDPGIAVYRRAIAANYRNALAATYRVVRDLTGAPFFNAAVDAFVLAHPPKAGDLNVYGGDFAAFLASYPYGRDVAYLPDVARLEWALDEANRAADPVGSPQALLTALAAIPGHAMARQRFVLGPSCRFVTSPHPVFRIWQVHQLGHHDVHVDFDAGADHLLVRREGALPVIERLAAGDYAWLVALSHGADLARALDDALAADSEFELGAALRAHVQTGTLMALA